MPFIIFVRASSFSFRNAASAALDSRERSSPEAKLAEPMVNPTAVPAVTATSEVINLLLLFKIRIVELSHLKLIDSPFEHGPDAAKIFYQKCLASLEGN